MGVGSTGRRLVRWALAVVLGVSAWTGTGRAADAAAAPPKVRKDLKVEDLGSPILRRKLGTTCVFRAADTKHVHLLLTLTGANELGGDPPYQILDFDLDTGQVRTAMGCEGSGGRTWLHSNGKLYIAQGRPPVVVEYDPATAKTRICGRLVENYFHAVQSVDEGPDGALYFGLYGRHAARYDPRTDKTEDFGPMDGESNTYVYTIASDGRFVYAGIADVGKWYLVVYDIQKKTQENFFKPKPGEPSGGNVARLADGTICWGGAYVLKDGKPLRPEKPLPTQQARNEGLWALHEVEKDLGLELDLYDVNPSGWNKGTVTVKWRKKGEAEWRSASFSGVQLTTNPPYRMTATPEGKLLGVGSWYGPVFLLDPETGQSTYLGVPPGDPYVILVVGDRAYFCGYSAIFAVYDRTKPWTLTPKNQYGTKGTNPSFFSAAKWATDMVLGADGRLYVAGSHGRHNVGGQMDVYDPKADAMVENIREPLLKHSVRDLCALDGGRLIVLSTNCIEQNGVGKVMVYDTVARKIVKEFAPLPGRRNTGQMFPAGPSEVVGLIRTTRKDEAGKDVNESLLYGLDVLTEKVLFEKTIPGKAFNGPTEFDFRSSDSRFCVGPDGCGWLFIDKNLTRIHPDGTVEKVLEMQTPARMLFLGKDLYFYSGGRQFFGGFSQVLRIRNVLE